MYQTILITGLALISMLLPTAPVVTKDAIGEVRYEAVVFEPIEKPKIKAVKAKIKLPERVSSSGSNQYSQSLQSWLKTLRMCESGSSGLYKANTGNGYYGAYQFLISTWDRIASKVRPRLVGVRPDLASPADQDYMIVQNTKLSAGGLSSQNPGCYQKTGISKFPPN